MSIQMWAYPWDLDAVGVEQALDEMQAVGVTGVSVATSYHAGRFVEPRLRPQRLYYPEDGTVHVPVTVGHGAIQPVVSAFGLERPELLAMLRRETERRHMALASWTVMLHNSRLGAIHPQATVENAWGGRLRYSLCPSHPAVRSYAVHLAKALVRQYDLDVVELESLGYMGLVHEYHHEKDGVGLTAAEQLLAGLCFCSHCMSRAAAAGVDAEGAREYTRRALKETLGREVPAPAMALEALWQVPALSAYWRWRTDNVHVLIREIKAALPARTDLRVLDLFGPDEARFYGLDYARVLKDADSVCACLYDRPPATVGRAARRLVAVTGGGPGLWAGFRLFVPENRDRDDFLAKVGASRAAGVESLCLYNYGLVPKARLAWIAALGEAAA